MVYSSPITNHRQTPSSPPPLYTTVTSPILPSYATTTEKPTILPRSQTAGGLFIQPVCLVQSKTRAKAKAKSERGGSKIFENYQCTVNKRTQHQDGNLQRRIRRTTSCGSLEKALDQGFKLHQVLL